MNFPSAQRTVLRRGRHLATAALAGVALIGLASSLRKAAPVQLPRPSAGVTAAARPTRGEPAREAPSPAAGAEETAPPILGLTRLVRQSADRPEARAYALARTDPAAAFRKLDDLDAPERLAWMRGIFRALACSDTAWALAYARQLPPGPERQAALTALLDGWGYPPDESPEQQARRTAAFGPDADLGLFLLEGSAPRPDLAVLWAEQLATGQGRTQLLGLAAVAQAPADPTLALSYGDGLDGDAQQAFDAMMVRGWTRRQPDDAWQWSSGLADPVQREEMQSLCVSELSAMDPPAAVDRLAFLPSGDDNRFRQQAVAETAANLAKQNTNDALAWAQSLAPGDQKTALEAIGRQAPAGVGP